MKHHNSKKYLTRARKLFCQGTCFKAPADVVLSGQRTLEEWVAVLARERDLVEYPQTLNSTESKTID